MMRLSMIAAMSFALLTQSPAAWAASYTKLAPSGRATMLDGYMGWNDDCSFLVTKIDFTSKPAHGRISVRVGQGRIGNASFGSAGKCFGKPTKVLQIWYTPDRGYHGTDSLSLNLRTIRASATQSVPYYYSITVQ